MTLSKGLIRADIIAAKQAIECFEEKKIRDMKNIAAYHLQQAAEKLIKYQIYNKCNSINYKQMYTHQIEKLIIYADSLNIGVVIPDYIREQSLTITAWEVGSRYDIGFSIRIDTLRKACHVIESWERKM